MPPQLHQSWEKPTCGCAPVTFVMGQGLQASSPLGLACHQCRLGARSPAFPRLCRMKVLLFWTGWVSASPRPWCNGVGGCGTCRSQGLHCAWPTRSHLCGFWGESFSPSSLTLLTLTYPQHTGLPCQCKLLSWFREGDVLEVLRSHPQPLQAAVVWKERREDQF